MTKPLTVGFIGAGAMARAMAAGMIATMKHSTTASAGATAGSSGADARNGPVIGQLLFVDVVAAAARGCAALDPARCRALSAASDAAYAELLLAADVVILAVKPQAAAGALRQLGSAMARVFRDKQSAGSSIPPAGATTAAAPTWLFVSIMAGVEIKTIANVLASGAGGGAADIGTGGVFSSYRVARVMPNAPLLVRAGAVGFSSVEADEPVVRALFNGSAKVVERVPEGLLEAVTGVSGSGPAYIAMVTEALADGGVREGLPRALALRLAAATVAGTGEMVLHGNHDGGLLHPGALKDAVSSPAGTTIAAVAALEEAGVRSALIRAVTAATHRGIELRAAAAAAPAAPADAKTKSKL
jgi:pyrroline-5-carboxylate reductase